MDIRKDKIIARSTKKQAIAVVKSVSNDQQMARKLWQNRHLTNRVSIVQIFSSIVKSHDAAMAMLLAIAITTHQAARFLLSKLPALASCAVALVVLGCASTTQQIDTIVRENGFTTRSIVSQGFRLRLYEHRAQANSSRLHVYLEGDGRPWRTRTQVNDDPTPQRALALELMALDEHWSLYLGRPCYFGEFAAEACSPWMWTSGRYSEVVVAAMAKGLGDIIDANAVTEVRLIGYSGGGVIAWLLAERVAQVTQLVTVSANLDIDAWTAHHGYSRLSGSLNPSDRQALPERVRHWYLVGIRDRQVPPALIDAQANPAVATARILRFDADHRCCWVDAWKVVLATIE